MGANNSRPSTTPEPTIEQSYHIVGNLYFTIEPSKKSSFDFILSVIKNGCTIQHMFLSRAGAQNILMSINNIENLKNTLKGMGTSTAATIADIVQREEFPLLNLPPEIQAEVASFLGPRDICNLRQASRSLAGNQTIIRYILNKYCVTEPQIAAGWYHTLVSTSSGNLYTWGENKYGQLGLGNNNDQNQNTPQLVQLPNGEQVIQMAAGFGHTLALTSSGRLYAWGENDDQLGLRYNTRQNTPQLVPINEQVTQIAAEAYHTLVLTSTGKLYAWGSNQYGQLGLGNNNDQNQNTPQLVQLPINEQVTQIATGECHTLVLTSLGNLYVCGYNSDGQLGLGNNNNQNTPQLVPINEQVTQIAAGERHTLVLTSTGKLYAWGWNYYGKLGLGNYNDQNTPQLVPINEQVTQIAAGFGYTLALTSSGRLYAWGDNKYGQLGLGNYNNQNTPQLVPINEQVTQITAGGLHTLVLTSTGNLYAWGWNDCGQLGLENNNQNTNKPQQLSFKLPSIQKLRDRLSTISN